MALTKKQLQRVHRVENAYKTWQKHAEDNSYNFNKFEDIKVLAIEQDILTPSGKITRAKSKQENVERFFSQFQEKIGSYSQSQKEVRKKFKEFKQRHADDNIQVSFKQFQEEHLSLNEVIDEMFDTIIPSDSAYDYFKLYQEEGTESRIEHYKEAIADFKEELIALQEAYF